MKKIDAIDLFCGVGGLTHGLEKAGINVKAGFDLESQCEYPFEENNDAKFIKKDVSALEASDIEKYFSDQNYSLIAGCAPCQPFSNLSNNETKSNSKWALLKDFASLVEDFEPDFVTMENVTQLRNYDVFNEFVERLKQAGYNVDYKSVHAPDYGIPQTRSRLILLASKNFDIQVPEAQVPEEEHPTVEDAIGDLPKLEAGETDDEDPLHSAAGLSSTNLERIRSSEPGGTWEDWDEELKLKCHKKDSGNSFTSVYGRMEWEKPSPTITTQFFSYGSGRFGHPEQDRAISMREGAIFQSFPEDYSFIRSKEDLSMKELGRLIGNAVPVKLGEVIGRRFKSKV